MKRPYIARGLTQQGRQSDGVRATCPDVASCRMPLCACHPVAAEAYAETEADRPGIRAPLPGSVDRWTRVLIGGSVLLFSAIGAVSLIGAVWRHFNP